MLFPVLNLNSLLYVNFYSTARFLVFQNRKITHIDAHTQKRNNHQKNPEQTNQKNTNQKPKGKQKEKRRVCQVTGHKQVRNIYSN